MESRTLGTASPTYDRLGAWAVGARRPALGLASGALAIVPFSPLPLSEGEGTLPRCYYELTSHTASRATIRHYPRGLPYGQGAGEEGAGITLAHIYSSGSPSLTCAASRQRRISSRG